MTLHCGQCSHEWTATPPMNVPLKEFIVWCRQTTCPNCAAGSARVLCGKTPTAHSAQS